VKRHGGCSICGSFCFFFFFFILWKKKKEGETPLKNQKPQCVSGFQAVAFPMWGGLDLGVFFFFFFFFFFYVKKKKKGKRQWNTTTLIVFLLIKWYGDWAKQGGSGGGF
jgi:hypothetical protein